jgi:uncharacterized delta-60 repeat protein
MNMCRAERLTLGGSLLLLLAACSPPSLPSEADAPGGASFPWSYVAPAGPLSALSLTPGENTLYYEPLLAAHNSWGPIEINRSNGEQAAGDGRPLTLNGQTYARGFGTHADSEMRYSLRGTGAYCTRFTASVGVDDEVGSRGSVVFQVFLDGVKRYDSGVLSGSSATRKVSVDLTGVQELRLVVTDAGNGISSDHADWADPKIYCVAGSAPRPGSPDPSYGQNGMAAVGGHDAVLEPDNAALIVGTVNGDFALKRLRPDGQVRQVLTDFGGQDAAFAVARQSDGRVVVAGRSGNAFALARYHADLSLDPSFGVGGRVITRLGGAGVTAAYAVAVQADGRIVAAGTAVQPVPPEQGPSSQDLAVVRYRPDGQLDPTFGRGGAAIQRFDSVTDPIDTSEDEARAVAAQPDGRLLVAGKADAPGGGRRWLLTRLNADGTLDMGFGPGGAVIGGSYAIFNDVALEAGGTVVAVGYEGRSLGEGVVRRYGPDGRLLAAATVVFSPTPGTPFDQNVLGNVLALSNGQVLVSGVTRPGSTPGAPHTVLARLQPGLQPDTGFGTAGQVVLPVAADGTLETPRATVLQQPDGRIVVVGQQSARVFP